VEEHRSTPHNMGTPFRVETVGSGGQDRTADLGVMKTKQVPASILSEAKNQ